MQIAHGLSIGFQMRRSQGCFHSFAELCDRRLTDFDLQQGGISSRETVAALAWIWVPSLPFDPGRQFLPPHMPVLSHTEQSFPYSALGPLSVRNFTSVD